MSRSEKISITFGFLFEVIAVYFVAAVLMQFFAHGASQQPAFKVGQILFQVYGYSSILVPFMLFSAGLLFFAGWDTLRSCIYVGGSVIPFITISIAEKVAFHFMKNDFSSLMGFKVAAVFVVAALLVAIEYLLVGMVSDYVLAKKTLKKEQKVQDDSVEEDDSDDLSNAFSEAMEEEAIKESLVSDSEEESAADSNIDAEAKVIEAENELLKKDMPSFSIPSFVPYGEQIAQKKEEWDGYENIGDYICKPNPENAAEPVSNEVKIVEIEEPVKYQKITFEDTSEPDLEKDEEQEKETPIFVTFKRITEPSMSILSEREHSAPVFESKEEVPVEEEVEEEKFSMIDESFNGDSFENVPKSFSELEKDESEVFAENMTDDELDISLDDNLIDDFASDVENTESILTLAVPAHSGDDFDSSDEGKASKIMDDIQEPVLEERAAAEEPVPELKNDVVEEPVKAQKVGFDKVELNPDEKSQKIEITNESLPEIKSTSVSAEEDVSVELSLPEVENDCDLEEESDSDGKFSKVEYKTESFEKKVDESDSDEISLDESLIDSLEDEPVYDIEKEIVNLQDDEQKAKPVSASEETEDFGEEIVKEEDEIFPLDFTSSEEAAFLDDPFAGISEKPNVSAVEPQVAENSLPDGSSAEEIDIEDSHESKIENIVEVDDEVKGAKIEEPAEAVENEPVLEPEAVSLSEADFVEKQTADEEIDAVEVSEPVLPVMEDSSASDSMTEIVEETVTNLEKVSDEPYEIDEKDASNDVLSIEDNCEPSIIVPEESEENEILEADRESEKDFGDIMDVSTEEEVIDLPVNSVENYVIEESVESSVDEVNEAEVYEDMDDEIAEDELEEEIDEDISYESVPPVVSNSVKPAAKHYYVPADGLLDVYPDGEYWIIDDETKRAAAVLKATLSEFKIEAEVTGIRKGPVITMFEILPAPGVKLNKIVALQDNIALRLAASSVRIVAPIPGKHAVGIEIPSKDRSIVSFRELIDNDSPSFDKMEIPVVLGKDITGEAKLLDLAATPHLLIAGSTGSGKSVCVNTMILSILYKRSPDQVKMILIDPKIVELKLYNDIPHLLTPVITEPKKAFQALQYCLCEMERRYAMLDHMGVRDIKSYNKRITERNLLNEKLPYIVIIIDEFADLMATTGKELESTVARLAAMSRAVGIHLVLATQRPSIDVITGLIKANIPTRIAFMVASKMDSRIIIDQVGAEKLLGKGDMLYASAVDPFPVRIQGTFVSETEVDKVVEYVKGLGAPEYIDEEIFYEDEEAEDEASDFTEGEDPLYEKALDVVIQAGKASASYVQRRLKIGYNRAARLVEEMEARGIVGPANGSKPRDIIHIPSRTYVPSDVSSEN